MAAYLPDVFLLSVFKKLNAHDRLNASQTCTNWYHRVREVNQAVKCLTILVGDKSFIDAFSDHLIDQYTNAYIPVVKQELMKDANKEEEDQDKFFCSTKWNTLHYSSISTTGLQLNSDTVQHIINAFPATAELNFFNDSKSVSHYEFLVQMLESGQNSKNGWSHQLTKLRVIDSTRVPVSVPTNKRLFTAINNLSVLKRLALHLTNNDENGLKVLDLPVLAHLKEVRFNQGKDEDLIAFLDSVQRYAADNVDLRIDLPNGFDVLKNFLEPTNANSTLLDPHIRERIVRVTGFIGNLIDLQLICVSFPHLNSLSIECTSRAECAQMIGLISQHLSHLLHLELYIDFRQTTNGLNEEVADAGDNIENGQIILPLLTSPLLSVKILQLSVTMTSHGDLQWLNLPVTMPNLHAIHFGIYCCVKCDTHSCIYDDTTLLKEQPIWNCFGAVLSQLTHSTSLPLHQITLSVGLTGSVVSGLGLAVF